MCGGRSLFRNPETIGRFAIKLAALASKRYIFEGVRVYLLVFRVISAFED